MKLLKIILIFLFMCGLGNDFGFAQEAKSPAADNSDRAVQTQPDQFSEQSSGADSFEVLRIKEEKEDSGLFSIELKNADLVDIFRVIAHDYNFNIWMDKGVSGRITASLTKISLDDALEQIAEMNNLIIERKENQIKVKPNLVTKVFVLKNIEAEKVLEKSDQGSEGTAEIAAQDTGAGQSQKSFQQSSIYDLLSEKGRVYSGKYNNSIMVVDYPENIKLIGEYMNMVDQGLLSKVFRLKYIKAKEIAGIVETSTTARTETAATEEPASAAP
ncbi:MAG: hypothetical protein HY810_09175 [Candidatus Omnitrophica bacterium]|nr:hypothetical protein [Candidatus Omnitrophota bacterium]